MSQDLYRLYVLSEIDFASDAASEQKRTEDNPFRVLVSVTKYLKDSWPAGLVGLWYR
ncbi:Protein of unknown function [Pyronema omphalodes CBS 100304]|uniref:Uncharacterized protein n=1 Tax=Pyronema omphalodes (strain CBS 100304) TaxID=1076935 RepID=U4LC07_PYROM|nr:Protein of unknown function [Pyronema omphalodes CBS 100304]